MVNKRVIVPKRVFAEADWGFLLSHLTIKQISTIIKTSGIPYRSADHWCQDLAEAIKDRVEVENNGVKFI